MVNPIIAFDEPQNDEARAKRMAAQYQQPVTGPRGVVASAGVPSAPKVPGIADGLAGGAKIIAGGAALPFAAGIDAARSGIASLAEGDPNTLPGGRSRYADSASSLLAQGIDQASAASDRLKAGARGLLGVQQQMPSIGADMPAQGQAAAAPAQQATPATGSQPAPATATPAIPANMPGQGDIPAGNGYTQAGNGIAMRTGAGGALEFTNDAAALSGARAMPAGGMRNIGNGIGGGLSVGDPGDSQLAIERFRRAGEIRQQTLADNRGTVTGLTDNRGRPSLADRQRASLDLQQAQAESLRAGTQQAGQQSQQSILSGMDERLTNQLNRQRTLQEIEVGRQSQETQQRIADLRAQIADASLSADQRQAAMQAYNALTLSPADRYMTVQGGTNEFGGKDASKVFDRLTGREVGANDSPAMAADLEQARRVIAADPSRRAEVERRLQQAYGRGLDG